MTSIHAIDHTEDSPEKNLAFDEALLDYAQTTHTQWLRFWESPTDFIVLGRGNKVSENVTLSTHIPVLRRCSGGGTVLQGPGCLNYALILSMDHHPDLASIPTTNCYILSQLKTALLPYLPALKVRGHSDLCLDTLKISGNAQRRKKSHLLFHGTLLYNFDISKVNHYLLPPPLQPDYRKNRPHDKFITNVPLPKDTLIHALTTHWNATPASLPPLNDPIATLLTEKYLKSEWHYDR
jgi:lipoate-protein ligase A